MPSDTKTDLFLGTGESICGAVCSLALYPKRMLMPLFSVKNSPLLVCCSAETTSSVGLDPLPQRVIVFYCLLVFANLPSSDLSEGPCSTSARQERILSAPSLLGAQGARIPCGSHLVQKEALREVCKRTCWLGWPRA